MSFFLGNDNSGNGVLHITKGVNTIEDMKSGVQPNTVLHNSMQLLTYTIYPIEVKLNRYYNGKPVYVWSIEYGDGPLFVYYQALSSEGFQHLASSELHWYLDANYNVLPQGLATVGSNPRFLSNYGVYSPAWVNQPTGYSATNYIPAYSINGMDPNAPYPFPTKYIVIAKRQESVFSSSSVSINHQGITVGSFNLGALKYVSKGIINSHPSCINLDGFHQLIDATKITGPLAIKSTIADGTTIKKGGHIIIDGLKSYSSNGVLSTYNLSIPSGDGKIFVKTLPSPETHVVVCNNRTNVITADGGTKEIFIYEYFAGNPYQGYLVLRIYYRLEGLNVFLRYSTTHSFTLNFSVTSYTL